MLNNYFLIAIYALVSLTITLVLFIIAYVLAPKRKTFEKNSAYECGFEPFDDARSSFDIQFFTVGILFIIFDLELAFLYP
jgi:NADH-quinone oxidoreductase subunit A